MYRSLMYVVIDHWHVAEMYADHWYITEIYIGHRNIADIFIVHWYIVKYKNVIGV